MAQQPPMQAMDTFVATMKDGSDLTVTKGQVLPWGHELCKRDREGSGTLFRPLDLGGNEEEPKSAPVAEPPQEAVKPAPAPAPAAPAKAATAPAPAKAAGKAR